MDEIDFDDEILRQKVFMFMKEYEIEEERKEQERIEEEGRINQIEYEKNRQKKNEEDARAAIGVMIFIYLSIWAFYLQYYDRLNQNKIFGVSREEENSLFMYIFYWIFAHVLYIAFSLIVIGIAGSSN